MTVSKVISELKLIRQNDFSFQKALLGTTFSLTRSIGILNSVFSYFISITVIQDFLVGDMWICGCAIYFLPVIQ